MMAHVHPHHAQSTGGVYKEGSVLRSSALQNGLGRNVRVRCTQQQEESREQHHKTLLRTGVGTLLCSLAQVQAPAQAQDVVASTDLSALLQGVVNQAESAGPAGVFLFIAVYAVSCVFLVPASVLTLGAGAVYGPVVGTAVVSASSTTGCVLAFLASRYLVRPFAEKQLAKQPLFESLQKRIPERGAKLVLLLRLTPVVPFGLLNYACGLTTLPVRQYAAASWLGMLPGTAAYVLLGSAGKETLVAAGEGIPSFQLALYGVGAVAALLATREISKIAQESIGDLKGDSKE